MSWTRCFVGTVCMGVLLAGSGVIWGQGYPSKPVRIVVNTPGGGSDFVARQIAQGITGPLGQSVIVDYHGSGIPTLEYAARATPDGYTLTVQGAVLWTTPLLQTTPYDAIRDFSPITLVTREANILAVHPSLPVKSVKDLIDLAKARPGQLNHSSGSVGSALNLAGELFKSMAGINILVVAYKGPSPALTALASGEVQETIMDANLLAPHIKSGRVRALAVTSLEPTPLVPGLPTVAATGLPGFEAVGMTGIWAPAQTPAAIVNRLSVEIVRYLRTPEAKERFFNAGSDVVANTPEQFADVIRTDTAKWAKVIKDANIKLN
jgi:tripartite-type tricarboxylate transporter receptor subunit TctC